MQQRNSQAFSAPASAPIRIRLALAVLAGTSLGGVLLFLTALIIVNAVEGNPPFGPFALFFALVLLVIGVVGGLFAAVAAHFVPAAKGYASTALATGLTAFVVTAGIVAAVPWLLFPLPVGAGFGAAAAIAACLFIGHERAGQGARPLHVTS